MADQQDDGMDLYGDLEDTKPAAAAPISKEVAPSSLSNNNHNDSNKKKRKSLSLAEHVTELETQLKSVQQENETLKRNIGTLYRTAKSEIDRKDAQIMDLMKQVDELNAHAAATAAMTITTNSE